MALMVRVIPKLCSCSRRPGALQLGYEELLSAGIPGPEAMTRMGWTRICCRTTIQTVPMYVVKDANAGAYYDDRQSGAPVIQRSPEITPKVAPLAYPVLPGVAEPSLSIKAVEVKAPAALAPAAISSGLPFPIPVRVVAIGAPVMPLAIPFVEPVKAKPKGVARPKAAAKRR